MISLTCKLIPNDFYRLSAVTYWRHYTSQMRSQSLSTIVGNDDDGRVRSLVCQPCSVKCHILVKIVKLYVTGVPWKGLSRSAIRKNDVMTFQLDMQVFKNIRVRWLPPGNAAPINEIPC